MNAFDTTGGDELRAEVSKLEVGPDDYVLVRVPRLNADLADRIGKHLAEAFPGRVIVLPLEHEMSRLTESDLHALIEGLEQLAATELHVVRFPSIMAIAMEVAPHVREGHLTDREGNELVQHRYWLALSERAERQST